MRLGYVKAAGETLRVPTKKALSTRWLNGGNSLRRQLICDLLASLSACASYCRPVVAALQSSSFGTMKTGSFRDPYQLVQESKKKTLHQI